MLKVLKVSIGISSLLLLVLFCFVLEGAHVNKSDGAVISVKQISAVSSLDDMIVNNFTTVLHCQWICQFLYNHALPICEVKKAE